MGHTRAGKLRTGAIVFGVLSLLLLAAILWLLQRTEPVDFSLPTPYQEAFRGYFDKLSAGDYTGMYEMLDASSRAAIAQEAFVTRHQNIYGGIDAVNIQTEWVATEARSVEGQSEEKGAMAILYRMHMDTCAGSVSFDNAITVHGMLTPEGAPVYRLVWEHSHIFPQLTETDRVSVSTTNALRGSIYDRNGQMLAGTGIVKAVGFVPGKMREDPAEDIRQVSEILEIPVETIQKSLSAKWAVGDVFVPLKKLAESDVATKERLLVVANTGAGLLIRDEKDRVYPLGEKAAHLTGYIAPITAEELEERRGKGYTAESRIGKLGLEALLEDRLRGENGARIRIMNAQGEVKETLAERGARDGEDVQVTIDAGLQTKLYGLLMADKAACAVMHPKTGEVLALLSTPAYDPNQFVLGLSQGLWEEWNNDAAMPLYNRFKAVYSPGSSFKPVIGAIGLSAGAFSADEDFGRSGSSWQQNASWGAYTVTTLKEYAVPARLINALVYSDNIYFAKAALKIGADGLAQALTGLGFHETVPFLFGLTQSSFGVDGQFESEVALADSGYGQGRIRVNVLHMASLYSAFLNDGSMVNPQLELGKGKAYYKENAFTGEAAHTVRDALIEVVENPDGTAHEARVNNKILGGKTGTAEIKLNKDDETGTELGWYVTFDAGETTSTPYLAVCMVEDVKGRGGSHYVLDMIKTLFTD